MSGRQVRLAVWAGTALAVLMLFAFVAFGQPLLAIAWGLGFASGVVLVGAAVAALAHARSKLSPVFNGCPACGGGLIDSDTMSQGALTFECSNGHRIVARMVRPR